MKKSPQLHNNWWLNNQENAGYYKIISNLYPHFELDKVEDMKIKDYRIIFLYKGNLYSCELDSEAIFHLIMKSIKSWVDFHLDFHKNEANIHSIIEEYLWEIDDKKIKEIQYSDWYYICFYDGEIFMIPSFHKNELKNQNLKYTDIINLSEIILENFPDINIWDVKNISLKFEGHMSFIALDMQFFCSLKSFSVLQKEVLLAKARWDYDRE